MEDPNTPNTNTSSQEETILANSEVVSLLSPRTQIQEEILPTESTFSECFSFDIQEDMDDDECDTLDQTDINKLVKEVKKEISDLDNLFIFSNEKTVGLEINLAISLASIRLCELNLEREIQHKLEVEAKIKKMKKTGHTKLEPAGGYENIEEGDKELKWKEWCDFISPTQLEPLRAKFALHLIRYHPLFEKTETAAQCFISLYKDSFAIPQSELLICKDKKFYFGDHFTCNSSEMCFLHLNTKGECVASGVFTTSDRYLMISEMLDRPLLKEKEICLQNYEWKIKFVTCIERTDEKWPIRNCNAGVTKTTLLGKNAANFSPQLIKTGSSVAMHCAMVNNKWNDNEDSKGHCAIKTSCSQHNLLVRVRRKMPSLKDALELYNIVDN
jgi:hypothetical protein